MSKRWIVGLICVGGVAILAFLAATWQPELQAIEPPKPSSFTAEQVAQGKVLATAAGCVDCHTVPGKPAGAGGVGLRLMFGTVIPPNITPDPDAGIGRWSLAAFIRAMRDGVTRRGQHMLQGFPIEHFTRLTDPDIAAIYAYMMTLPPVKERAPPSQVPFPLSVRSLQAVWKAIYVEPGAYRPDPAHSAQWNRGAYLADSVVRCNSCHTPRNSLGALQVGHPYGSTRTLELWWSAPLDIPASPLRWTEAEMTSYLRTGISEQHGVALDEMQRVTRSLRALPDEDLAAISNYIISLALPVSPVRLDAIAKHKASPPAVEGQLAEWAKPYMTYCADCHDRPGATPQSARSPIGLSTALWMDEPNNFVRITLDGIKRVDGVPGPTMPGFRDKLSDQEIANITNYLRRSQTILTTWSEIDIMVGKIRAFSDGMAIPP